MASCSIVLISLLFAAVYKVLPDRNLKWSDVAIGAIVTAVLFTVGKSLISWYIGSSAVASSFGAAGALIVLLLWVYYSAQIFLLGAEFTKVWAERHGSKQGSAAVTQSSHPQTRLSGGADANCPQTKTAVAGLQSSRIGRYIPQYLFDGLAISQMASDLADTHQDFDRRIDDYLQKYPDEDRGTLVADLAVAAAEARRIVEALVAAPHSQWHDEGAAIEVTDGRAVEGGRAEQAHVAKNGRKLLYEHADRAKSRPDGESPCPFDRRRAAPHEQNRSRGLAGHLKPLLTVLLCPIGSGHWRMALVARDQHPTRHHAGDTASPTNFHMPRISRVCISCGGEGKPRCLCSGRSTRPEPGISGCFAAVPGRTGRSSR